MVRRLGVIILSAALLLVASMTLADAAQYRLQVAGLACPFCAYGIEKELQEIDGVRTVETHIKDGAVVVEMTEGATLDRATARRAVEAAGFTLGGFQKMDGKE